MSYRQPGVKITQQKNTSFTGAVGAYLPVCIVGSGVNTVRKVFKLIKTSADYSFITDEDGEYVDIDSIIRIGNTKDSEDYNIGTHLTDYTLDTESIDGVTVTVIKWTGGETDRTPVTGNTFYAEVEVTPADKHFTLKVMSSKNQIVNEYGADIVDGVINSISLAAQIALENTAMVYVIKAKKVGDDMTAAELQVALDQLKGSSDPYRIVLADAPKADLNLALLNHIRLMSDPEEGMERVGIFAAEHTSSSVSEIITNVGDYAAALNDYRTAVIYPDKARRTLSDGSKQLLPGSYIAVALAALKASLRPEQAYTGKQITNFDELVGIAMTRSEKNMLAEKGVMVLTQEKSGFPVEVRHGLSTDMSSIQMREISVTELADFVSRAIRPALRNYKGQNINKSLLTQIGGSVTAVLNGLTRQGNILAGSSVVNVYQVETSPDTVAVEVRVNVPYPCNYIDIVIAYD